MSPPPDPSRESRTHLLWDIVGEGAAEREGEPALLGGSVRLTYGELAGAVRRGAEDIDRRFARGSRVLIAAYDQMAVAVAFLAALQSRCLPLLVDPQSPPDLARIARRWDVRGFVGDPDLVGALGDGFGLDDVRAWIAVGADGPVRCPAVAAREPAFWTFTSGTTGEPRAVIHGHGGPKAAFDAFGRGVVGLHSADRTASTAGLPFVYALGNNLLFPLLAGGAAILPSDLLLPTVLGEIRRWRASILVSGPWSLEAMARLADRRGWGDALRALRRVLSAGEPLAEAVFHRWRDAFGQSPIDNLGCTEMFNSFLSPRPDEAAPGCLGRVVPGFEVRVGGRAAAPGGRGALEVRGPSRAIGLSRPGTSVVESASDDWCATGDEVEVDEDGRFAFLGRLDDRFKVRGQFVRPAEVENQLRRVAGIRECLVSADTDERGLARAVVHVVLDEGADATSVLRGVGAAAREVMPAAARSMRITRVGSLPRSARGKLLR